jgi:hypothetical protein
MFAGKFAAAAAGKDVFIVIAPSGKYGSNIFCAVNCNGTVSMR